MNLIGKVSSNGVSPVAMAPGSTKSGMTLVAAVLTANPYITAYFDRMKKLRDDLDAYVPPRACSCSPCTCGLSALVLQQERDSCTRSVASPKSAEEKYRIVRSIGEECIQEDELRNLLAKKLEPVCYDGFEPSGLMHIAQGALKMINVNKLIDSGCRVKIWIADWFAMLNGKMGGDLKKIEVVGQYFIEMLSNYGSYRARGVKCSSNLVSMYACADIFFLKADICQMGMDQRKVNVLAREYCDDIKRKNKPIILSHHMLPGLKEGQEKMSKSDPSSSIYMEDDEAEVNSKIKKAFCPPKIVEGNPCL